MTDLDQRLAEAFERRASLTTGGIAPAAVTRLVRRQRQWAAAGAVGVVVLAVAAVVAVAPGQSRVDGGAGDSKPSSPPAVPPLKTLASLAVTRTTEVSFVSFATKPTITYEICETNTCVAVLPNPSRIDPVIATTSNTVNGIYGLAPSNATSIRVSVGTGPARTAKLVTLPVPGHPRLFVLSGIRVALDVGQVPHADEHFKAIAANGRVIAETDVLGSVSLAKRHPVSSALVSLPGGSGANGQVVWGSADHWVCTGTRALLKGTAAYRASSCTQILSSTQVVPMNGAVYVNTKPTGPASWQMVWTPADVTSVMLALPKGQRADVTMTPGAGGQLVLISADTVDVTGPGVLTAKTASGRVVYSGKINSLPSSNTRGETAGQPIYSSTTGK